MQKVRNSNAHHNSGITTCAELALWGTDSMTDHMPQQLSTDSSLHFRQQANILNIAGKEIAQLETGSQQEF
jgi:hypothetical protein